jgi:hypothetical protein
MTTDVMPTPSREDRYFRQLMEADAVVRPALIREWSRRDRVLAERLTRMLDECLRPEPGDRQHPRRQRIAV